MIGITAREMQDFAGYIAEISGIALDQNKKYLLENRLQAILEEQACSSFHDLLLSARRERNGALGNRIIDAVATNETFFFRDRIPFEILRHKIIPDILDRKKKQNLPDQNQIRLWCAACSTGQEVYSVIMSILETVPDRNKYDIRVLGTDISGKAIARASSGRYSAHETGRGLPLELRNKYFIQEGDFWRIRDEVRIMADFKRLNLLEPFYGIGPFDVIFCRNVSIYFSTQNKVELFAKLGRILDKNGFLIIGGSESLGDIAPQFTFQRHLKGIFYQRADASGHTGEPARGASPPAPAFTATKSNPAAQNISRPSHNGSTSVESENKTNTVRIVPGTTGPMQQRLHATPTPQAMFPPQPDNCLEKYPGKPGEGAEPSADHSLFITRPATVPVELPPLLESVLRKNRPAHSLLTGNRNQDETRRSLLKIIRENHEKQDQENKSSSKQMSSK